MPSGRELLATRGHDERRPAASLRVAGMPRVPTALILRERLLSLLDADPAPALTVLQAGSGFGKTSLLVQWARRRAEQEPVVWITAEEPFPDPSAFWRDVHRGLAGVGLLDDDPEPGDPTRDTGSALSASLRRRLACLRSPVTLVVDHFERIGRTETEHRLIELVTRVDGLRLVVATRMPSEIASAATASRLDLRVVDAAALRFSDREIRRLAARLEVGASPRELEQLGVQLDGWPFGVRVLLERRLRAESAIASAQHGLLGAAVISAPAWDADHLDEHVLRSLRDLDRLDRLAVTSVLESFDLDQAAALGFELDAHLLHELEARGMGAWRLDAEPPEYRLHPALRRALRDRLGDDRARTAFGRLALRHAARREFGPAFDAAIRAEEWTLAARCVRSDLFAVLMLLRQRPDALDAVPRPVLHREPLLMLVSGIAHHSAGRHAKAVRTLLAAVAAFEHPHGAVQRAPTPDQVWVQGILTIALRLAGRHELVPVALRRFRRMLETVDDPDGQLDPAMVLFRAQTVITLAFMDELGAAEQLALDTMIEQHRATPFQQANLRGLTAFAHARRGDPVRAAAVLESIARTGAPPHFTESLFAVPMHIAAAWTALERFEPEEADAALRRADPHRATTEHWPFVLEARVHVDWQRQGPASALMALRESRSEKRFAAPIGDAVALMLVALEAELLLAAGRGAEARALLTPARLRRSTRLEVPRSRSLLLRGDGDQAAAIADRHAHSAALPWQDRIDLLLISASANLRAGDHASAQARFDEAAAIAQRVGVLLPFASMPRADLLALSLRRPELQDRIPERPARYPEPEIVVALSRREQHVLAALASDRTLPEIAQLLSVSKNTLKSQLRSVYRKLDVSNRQEAVAFARRTGLMMVPQEQRPDALSSS